MTVELSPVELRACWYRLGLGDPPLALDLGPLGGTDQRSRAALLDQAFAALARRGLVDRHGPVRPLCDALRLLAAPEYSVDVRLVGGFGPLVGVGAVGARRAVLLTRPSGPGSTITVRPVPDLPSAVAALPGPLRPGRARPVNIPAEVFDRAVADTLAGPDPTSHWQLADRLTALGVDRAEASSLARMCTGISASGQIGATTHPGGRAYRAPWVVGFHRSRAGNFVQLRRLGTVTVAPVDTDRLRGHLRQLLRAAPHPVLSR